MTKCVLYNSSAKSNNKTIEKVVIKLINKGIISILNIRSFLKFWTNDQIAIREIKVHSPNTIYCLH
jgi:hypothetical protein